MSNGILKGAGLVAALLLAAAPGAEAQKARTAPAKAAAPFGANELAAAQASFGYALLQKMAVEPGREGRLVVAPASVAAALAFLDLGTDRAMHGAIVKSLGFEAAQGSAAMQRLRDAAKVLSTPGEGPLAFADAIFIDPAAGLRPSGVTLLTKAGMAAETQPLGTEPGIAAINAWVDKHTKGRIKTILEAPLPGASFVAVNALHFKDDWRTAFDAGLTKPRTFERVGGATLEVPMMALRPTALSFRQDDKFIAVTLPYKSAGYSLVVLTTKGAPAALADFAPVAGWLGGSGFAAAQGTLALPRFGAETSIHLLSHLEAMGLAEGATPTAFEKLSKTPLKISDIVQKTMIKVDEAGTEAAAATAVITTRALRVADLVEMVVDKPFLFALRDEKNGLTLLTGYIDDPSAK